jgi:hypothetical protein
MNEIHNKHGPDCDVGFLTSGRPRDGTERKPRDRTERRPRDGIERRPRDGTERRPRDGIERRPRDGTERKPRDKILLRKGTLVIRYFYRLTGPPQDVRTHYRPSSKWRIPRWKEPALGTGKGRSMFISERIDNG